MNLVPLGNNIIFRFLDETAGKKGAFTERSASGIIIPRTNSTQKSNRWAEVLALGPKAVEDGLAVGDYILIEALMWTEGVVFNDEKVWKTDSAKVIAVTTDLSECQSQAL